MMNWHRRASLQTPHAKACFGKSVINRYRNGREECLIDNLDAGMKSDIGAVARTLRAMSGLYDQATRAASSL